MDAKDRKEKSVWYYMRRRRVCMYIAYMHPHNKAMKKQTKNTYATWSHTYSSIEHLYGSIVLLHITYNNRNGFASVWYSIRWVHNKIISEWMKILSATIICEFYCAQNVIDIRECTTLYDFAIHPEQFSSLKIIFSLPEKALIAFKKGDGNCLSSFLPLSSRLFFRFYSLCL